MSIGSSVTYTVTNTLGGVLSSAVRYGFSYIFQGTILKLIIFTGLLYVLSLFGEMMVSYIPDWISDTSIKNNTFSLPSGVKFFLGMMALDYGFPFMISSMLIRFMIRRLPFIG
jgi:hypothetical protein